MAWPKGRARKPVGPIAKTHEPVTAPVTPAPIVVPAPPPPPKPLPADPPKARTIDVLARRREVCALRVRGKKIPPELQPFDWLPLAKIAKVVRAEMAKDKATDDEVEAYVATYCIKVW